LEETKLYTMKDLCKYLGIGRNTALSLLNEHKIRGFKAGRHWVIPIQEIERYIKNEVNQNDNSL
jgi:excisionase family DNA binding protein